MALGSNIGFNITNKNSITHTTLATVDTPEVITSTESSVPDLKILDAGIVVAGGVFMPLKNNFAVTLEVRYDLGILPILENNTMRNRAIGAMLGVSF